jgi:endonuclease/exonuclease/phosphatase family metal-dependent hydrolase
MRVLFSNLGYARGINGSLWHHTSRAFRHLYFSPAQQHLVLRQLKALIDEGRPDLCCLVEIDRGSRFSGGLNQIEALRDPAYPCFDIADKYGGDQGRRPAMQEGRSNAFLARDRWPFERLYLRHGTKRLVYKIQPSPGLTVFFAHFSLKSAVRAAQFAEMREWIGREEGEVMLLADFNIMQGFRELLPLTGDGGLVVLNREDQHTFIFHRRRLALDLCLCTPGLAARAGVTVVPQPFSDHAALLVDTDGV